MAFSFDSGVFSTRLRALVAAKEETYEVLAARCAMPKASFESYLYHQNLPSARQLAKLSYGLNVSADWLLFGDAQKQTCADDGFACYRIRQDNQTLAQYTGPSSDVMQMLDDYISRYRCAAPAKIEEKRHGQWVLVAQIASVRTGRSQ